MLKKGIVAISPILFIISWFLVIPPWGKIVIANINPWVKLLAIPQLIGATIALVSNYLMPVSRNRKEAIQVAVISMCAYLLFYVLYEVVNFFIFPTISVLETVGFSIVLIIFLYTPMSFLFMGIVAFIGRLGARLRIGNDNNQAY